MIFRFPNLFRSSVANPGLDKQSPQPYSQQSYMVHLNWLISGTNLTIHRGDCFFSSLPGNQIWHCSRSSIWQSNHRNGLHCPSKTVVHEPKKSFFPNVQNELPIPCGIIILSKTRLVQCWYFIPPDICFPPQFERKSPLSCPPSPPQNLQSCVSTHMVLLKYRTENIIT